MVETSVLVSGSIFWEHPADKEIPPVKEKFFKECDMLFNFLRENSKLEIGIITKTVETEAKNALNGAVIKAIRQTFFPDPRKKIKVMIMQHAITYSCLDRLEKNVEECSVRLPIDKTEREKIKSEEIEPFMKDIVRNTIRYIQPPIPKFIKGGFRDELRDIIVRTLPSKKIIYRGMPKLKDLVIMAEATMIYRKYEGKEKIYVVSVDNHFKPNPVQVGSYLSENMWYTGEVDSTVRDKVAERFGFIGEEPIKTMQIAAKELNL